MCNINNIHPSPKQSWTAVSFIVFYLAGLTVAPTLRCSTLFGCDARHSSRDSVQRDLGKIEWCIHIKWNHIFHTFEDLPAEISQVSSNRLTYNLSSFFKLYMAKQRSYQFNFEFLPAFRHIKALILDIVFLSDHHGWHPAWGVGQDACYSFLVSAARMIVVGVVTEGD